MQCGCRVWLCLTCREGHRENLPLNSLACPGYAASSKAKGTCVAEAFSGLSPKEADWLRELRGGPSPACDLSSPSSVSLEAKVCIGGWWSHFMLGLLMAGGGWLVPRVDGAAA